MSAAKIRAMELELLHMQERFKKAAGIDRRAIENMKRIRGEYRELHRQWVQLKGQGALL